MAKRKQYKLKGTFYKNRTLKWAIENHKEYFEELVKDPDWVKLSASDRSNIKKALGLNTSPEATRNHKGVEEAITLFKEGYSRSYIIDELRKTMSLLQVQNIMISAKAIMGESYNRDRDTMIGLHIKRYEKIYHEHAEPVINQIGLLPWQLTSLKVNHYLIALEALQAKEKALGMHTKSYMVQLNNFFQSKVKEEVVQYNFTKLTLEELIELKSLIDLMKDEEKPIEIIRPDMKKQKVEVEDVEYEEIKSPLKEEIEKIPVIAEKKSKTLDDVKDKMAESFKKKLLESMKKSGSKIIDDKNNSVDNEIVKDLTKK